MYIWEGKSFGEIGDLPRQRDPLRFPVGAITQGADAASPVLLWFASRGELSAFLHRLEPQRWGMQGPALLHYKDASQEAFAGLDMLGPTEGARSAINAVAAPHFQVLWWGDLRDLLQTAQPAAASLRAEYQQGDTAPIPLEASPGFLDFLQQRYGPSGN